MTSENRLDFYDRLFRATAFDHDSDIWWRERNEDSSILDFYVVCNDIFAWGFADLELITSENIHILEEAVRDCRSIDDHVWAPILFCARVRGERPQGAVLKDMPPGVLALFDAVGEKRLTNIGNPYAHPEDGGAYEYKSTCDDK